MTKKLLQESINSSSSQKGAALIMALIMALVLSIIVIGYSTDVDLDIYISRNLQLKNQAFNWAETGVDVAEELVAYSADTRGDDPVDTSDGATAPITFNTDYQATAVTFDTYEESGVDAEDWDFYPLFLSEDALIFICDISSSDNPVRVADVNIEYKGSSDNGSSIIIAAGYEGVGKGAGAGGMPVYYQMVSQGYERHNSCQSIGVMYRHVTR